MINSMMEFLNSINFFGEVLSPIAALIGWASVIVYMVPHKEDSKVFKFLSIIALKKEVKETTPHTHSWNQGGTPHPHSKNIYNWVIKGNRFMEGMESMEEMKDKPPDHPLPNRRAAIAHTKARS